LAQLPKKFHQRYLEREGYFSDTRSSLASRRLDACAGDLWELIDQFRGDPKLFKLKQYRHLKRVFKDQCEEVPPQQETQAEPVEVHKGPKEAKVEVSAEASDVSFTVTAWAICACEDDLPSSWPPPLINVKRAVKYALKTMNEAAQTHLPAPQVISARIFSRKPALWSLLKGFLKPLGSLQPVLREWATNGAL
jgi:hypothetical protein